MAKKRRLLIAQIVSQNELTNEEIAKQFKISPATLWIWRKHPDFVAEVTRLTQEEGDSAARYSIAMKARRIREMDTRYRKLLAVIEARGKDKDTKKGPGGKQGVIVRTLKSIGGGEYAETVEEYAVDTGLLKEIRELEKQAAIEMGQWIDKKEVTGPAGGPVEIIEVRLKNAPDTDPAPDAPAPEAH